MAIRHQIKERNIEKVRRERAPIPWQYCLQSLLCAVILAFGFFYAAKQHFSSIEMSMKNSKMRETKEKLEAEQRKLRVEREGVSSPATIEKAGLKIGLRRLSSDDFQFIDGAQNVTMADNSKAGSKSKLATATNKLDTAKLIKTVYVRPVDADKKEQNSRSGTPDIAKAPVKDNSRALIAKK
jgi:hypothetical protein